MASTTPFFDAILARRTMYSLENKSPISDERIKEIVEFAIKNCPSSFNVQSARAVILLGAQHEKLWDMGEAMTKRSVPEQVYSYMAPKIQGYRKGYGSVMWFEDQESIDTLSEKNAMLKDIIPEWSDHSSGMHQFVVWTAFEAEGLGCNLQHFNLYPGFTKEVVDEWKLPATWKLKSQLVFGTPTGPPMEKTFKPLEDRVKMI